MRRVSTSRGERSLFAERWGNLLAADDPFYNPHFSREGGVYRELKRDAP